MRDGVYLHGMGEGKVSRILKSVARCTTNADKTLMHILHMRGCYYCKACLRPVTIRHHISILVKNCSVFIQSKQSFLLLGITVNVIRNLHL